MFELWTEKKVFMNVDETWLGMSDFRQMKWQQRDTKNSVSITGI